jgi:hypothetical protein
MKKLNQIAIKSRSCVMPMLLFKHVRNHTRAFQASRNVNLFSIAICFFVTGCSSAYKEGYSEGKKFGSDLAQQAKMTDMPIEILIDPDQLVSSMRISGVTLPYNQNKSKQKQWINGYKAGLNSLLSKEQIKNRIDLHSL